MKKLFFKSLIIAFIAFISYSTLTTYATYAAETVDSEIQTIIEDFKKEGYTKNELKEYLIKNDIEVSSVESVIDSVYLTDKEEVLQKLNNLDKGKTNTKKEDIFDDIPKYLLWGFILSIPLVIAIFCYTYKQIHEE